MLNNFSRRIEGKNAELKKQIIGLCVNDGAHSIAELSRKVGASVPTVTKLVFELIDASLLIDMGKQSTSGGRRPSIFGLSANAGYFLGVDVRRESVCIAVTDFKGDIIVYSDDIPFLLESTEASFNALCDLIKLTIHENDLEFDKILGCGINFTGRVNKKTGYCFAYDLGPDRPLETVLEEHLNLPVTIENDSRAMTYGEYLYGPASENVKDMIFLNVSWGLGMGLILRRKLHYGKSGYSGEFGHFPMLQNNVICQCGKTGCLETGASGLALYRMVLERLAAGRVSSLSPKYQNGERITLDDILAAIRDEDVLAIECIEEVGTNLGRGLAGIINLFNPETVIIGGRLEAAGDYLMLPIRSAVNKFSLSLVNKDTPIEFSKMGSKAGPLGACMLSRSKTLGLI